MLATLDQQRRAFRDDVLAGLSAPVPAVPARWLYDLRGSQMHDQVRQVAQDDRIGGRQAVRAAGREGGAERIGHPAKLSS